MRLAGRVKQLLEEAKLAGAKVRALTELQVEASTSLTLQAEQPDTLMRLSRDPLYASVARGLVDSVFARFDDGVFAGRVAYFPMRGQFGLDFRAQFAAALAITDQPDGSVLFAAVPSDPRIRLTLTNSIWVPPPSADVCTWGQRGKAAVVGSLATLLIGAVR
jgi:hypothetical protein